jgi:hypothetical protein
MPSLLSLRGTSVPKQSWWGVVAFIRDCHAGACPERPRFFTALRMTGSEGARNDEPNYTAQLPLLDYISLVRYLEIRWYNRYNIAVLSKGF